MPEEISRVVDKFIHDNISSVEQLEVLLFLVEHAHLQWSAAEVAQKLYRQPSSVAFHLDTLQSQGLLAKTSNEALRFRYAPIFLSTDTAARALAQAYSERKDAIIRLIYSRPSNSRHPADDVYRF